MNSLVRIMNEDIIKKAIFWQILYIVIYGFCAVIINIYFTDVILFVYGIEKNDVLIPTCGLGEYHTVRCYKEAFNKRQVLQVVLLSHHNQQSNRIDIPTAYEKNTIELPFWQAVLLCYDEIADEIFKLREQREKCTVDTAARDAQIARINELQDFIKQQPAHLEAFDEALVKRWLERIIVWENHFTVELKSGLKIDIER